MKFVTANEAKQSLGRVMEEAQLEPVMIRKHDRDAAVLLSPREYDRLRGLNVAEFTAFCDGIGSRAKKKGLTPAALSRLLEG